MAKAEHQLENYPTIQNANVGDILEDGTIVLIKNDKIAIIVSANEFRSKWADIEFNFKSFRRENGYDDSWFIPDGELLKFAYNHIPSFFSPVLHWSSEMLDPFHARALDFAGVFTIGRNAIVCECSVRCMKVVVL